MPAKINPLIALAIPTWGKVSINWSRAFRRISGPLGANMVELSPIVGLPIAQARNELMVGAIENGCDFIFFLGDDVIPEPDVLQRLLRRMWENPEIDMVTGMYWTKEHPTSPYIWRGIQRGPYLDWKYGEFFEIDYAGCDCLLVRLSPKLKELGPEWFSTDWQWAEGDGISLMATEDFYFYTKTRKAGLKLWCDTLVQCVHEDRNSGIQYALTTDMPQFTGSQITDLPEALTDAAPLVKVADIGSGLTTPFFGTAEQVKIVRFDMDEKGLPDFRCDIRHLPVPDESFDIVHSRHVLEHFGRSDLYETVKEWARILRVGGEIRMSVPNLIWAIRRIMLMEEGLIDVDPYPWWQLYGRQNDQGEIHLNGFTPKRLQLLMEGMGIFEGIEVTTLEPGKTGEENECNIFVTAKKARNMEKHYLLPEWDVIDEAEGIVTPGRKESERESVVPETAERNGTGLPGEREEVLAASGAGRTGAPPAEEA